MNVKSLRKKTLLLLTGIAITTPAMTFASRWETVNWKGANVCAPFGGDGELKNVFDGIVSNVYDKGTKWGSRTCPTSVTINFENPQIFTTYEIATTHWTAGAKERSPQKWRVEGSNNNTTWIVLDDHSDGNEIFVKENSNHSFQFSNSTAYSSYRIVFESPIKGTYLNLQEINFPEYAGTTKPVFYKYSQLSILEGTVNVPYQEKKNLIETTNSSITMSTIVYSDPTAPITELGVVYSESNVTPDITNGTKVIGNFLTNPLFSATITGLEAGKTYYVRPFASNANETSYGESLAITTSDSEGEIFTTSSPTKRLASKTILPVVIADGIAVRERGIVWGTLPNPTIESGEKYIDNQATTGAFNGIMTNLKANNWTTYTRAYLIDNDGKIHYGAQYAFISLQDTYFWKEGASVVTDYTVECYKWENCIADIFNTNLNEQFTGPATNTSIDFAFVTPQKLTRYKIAPGTEPLRYPKDWTLSGSNDKKNWTIVDNKEGQSWSANEIQTFDFNNSTAYQYYKLLVRNAAGGVTAPINISFFDFPEFPNSDTSENAITATFGNEKCYVNKSNNIVIEKSADGLASITVINANGVCVAAAESVENEIVISKSLERGIYLVVINLNGKMNTQKVAID